MDFEVDFKVNLELEFRVTPCKGRSWILDSTLWISRFQYWIPHFLKKLELGFRIPVVGGIPNSLS